MRRTERSTAVICPYCRDSVARGAASVVCSRRECRALYHRDCWRECSEEHGHCAVYGCVSTASAEVSAWRSFVELWRWFGPTPRPKSDPRSAPTKAEIAERVLDLLSMNGQRLVSRHTAISSLFHGLGVDSLDTVELVMELEALFDLSLEPDVLEHETVGDLIDHIAEQLGED